MLDYSQAGGVQMRAMDRTVREVAPGIYYVSGSAVPTGFTVPPGVFQHTEHESANTEPGSLSTTTLDTPPGVGSILVAAFVGNHEVIDAAEWPAGWTDIGTVEMNVTIGGGSATLRYKVSEGASDQSLVIDKNGSFYAYCVLAELVGVSSLIDSYLADDVADGLPPAPAVGPVTATADGQIALGFAMIGGINNGIFLEDDPPWIELQNGQSGASPTVTFAYKSLADAEDATLTATSNTTGGGQDHYAGVLALFG